MRVYSNTLTMADLESAAARLGLELVPGAELREGPRTRYFDRVRLTSELARAVPLSWETRRELEGLPVFRAGRRARHHNATYDEHGYWMADLLERDPNARVKSGMHDFRGHADFHAQTRGAYYAARERAHRERMAF